jgi:hypothetical protein
MTIQEEQVTSASRRDFIKLSGVAGLGLIYTSPIVEPLRPSHRISSYSSSCSSGNRKRRPPADMPHEQQGMNPNQQLSG